MKDEIDVFGGVGVCTSRLAVGRTEEGEGGAERKGGEAERTLAVNNQKKQFQTSSLWILSLIEFGTFK